jgi:hypothetical protein
MDLGANPGEWCLDVFRADYYGEVQASPGSAVGHTVKALCQCNRRMCPHEAYTRARGEGSSLAVNITFRCVIPVPESMEPGRER